MYVLGTCYRQVLSLGVSVRGERAQWWVQWGVFVFTELTGWGHTHAHIQAHTLRIVLCSYMCPVSAVLRQGKTRVKEDSREKRGSYNANKGSEKAPGGPVSSFIRDQTCWIWECVPGRRLGRVKQKERWIQRWVTWTWSCGQWGLSGTGVGRVSEM